MAAVAAFVKSKCSGIDESMLQAIAASDAVEADGFVAQKGRAGKASSLPQSNLITLSKGFAGYREIDLFSPTTDDDPLGDPAECNARETMDKWFHRCATSITDGNEIKLKWDLIDAGRVMLGRKDLPTAVTQIRAEILRAESRAKAPPHLPGEGVGSSSSSGNGAATSGTGPKPTAATGTKREVDKVFKKKNTNVRPAKRAKTTPPERTNREPDAAPLPLPRDFSSEANQVLFTKWQVYYDRMLRINPIYTPDDVQELLTMHKKNLDAYQDRRDKLQQEGAAHPAARPEGNANECHRNNPISGKTDKEGD